MLALTTTAQDKIKYINSKTETDSSKNAAIPLLVIKGEDFRRFPNAGFLDAVEGMFPWVFGPGQIQADFLYVVNGYVLANINAVNLNDIEEVSFVRNNVHAELSGLIRLGTFFISTKKAAGQKQSFNFNSQVNVVNSPGKALYTGNNFFMPYLEVRTTDKKNDLSPGISNHLSFSASKNKWSFYSAAYHSAGNVPPSAHNFILKNTGSNDSSGNSFKGKGSRSSYGLLAHAGYAISSSLTAGVMVNYSHNKLSADSTFTTLFSSGEFNNTSASSGMPINTFSAGANINWKPSSKLENTLFVEYANNKASYDEERKNEITGSSTNIKSIRTTEATYKNKNWTARNETKYTLIKNTKVTAGLYLNALWLQRTFSEKGSSVVLRDPPGLPSFSSSQYSYAIKYGYLNPGAHISLNNVVNINTGAGYYFGPSFSRYKTADKIAPFANAVFNLQKLLRSTGGFQPSEVSFNYAKIPATTLYQSYNSSPITIFSVTTFSSTYIPNPSLRNFLPKNEMISVRLATAMFNNRILLSAEWNSFKYDKIFMVYVPGTYNYAVAAKETSKGFSATVSSVIINKKDFKLSGRYAAAFPKIKSDEAMKLSDGYINDDIIKAGLQQKAEYKNIFLQLNGLLHFGRVYKTASFNSPAVKKNDFALNYLLLGYNCGDKAKGLFNNGTIFLQARNVYISSALKELYLYDRYIGVGVNLVF